MCTQISKSSRCQVIYLYNSMKFKIKNTEHRVYIEWYAPFTNSIDMVSNEFISFHDFIDELAIYFLTFTPTAPLERIVLRQVGVNIRFHFILPHNSYALLQSLFTFHVTNKFQEQGERESKNRNKSSQQTLEHEGERERGNVENIK